MTASWQKGWASALGDKADQPEWAPSPTNRKERKTVRKTERAMEAVDEIIDEALQLMHERAPMRQWTSW